MVMKPQMFEIKVDLNRCGWDGMVIVVTHYAGQAGVGILVRARFSTPVQICSKAHRAPCTNSTRSFLELNCQGFDVAGTCC
jgi:hypothetical protein